MLVMAFVGSPRKGRATDNLVDKAIAGVLAEKPGCEVIKINLADKNIQPCRNCLRCRETKTDEEKAECAIKDDMVQISEQIVRADRFIFGTPVHMAYATGLMMTFLERVCWTFAKPERQILSVKGCPTPRTTRKKKAVIVVCSGVVPPIFRSLCDRATPLIKDVARFSLNAKTVGTMYAGALEDRGAEYYYDRAFVLGKKLMKE